MENIEENESTVPEFSLESMIGLGCEENPLIFRRRLVCILREQRKDIDEIRESLTKLEDSVSTLEENFRRHRHEFSKKYSEKPSW